MEMTHVIVTDLDVRPALRIAPEATVAQAACVLAETRGGALVVDTEPVSEVTERDLVIALADGATGETPLCEIKRSAPEFVRPETSVAEAAVVMIATGRRSLIVV